ncbi:hypothetical protein FISHEDRAFT_8255, partial [Fistulina hepatica ATCC 64428]
VLIDEDISSTLQLALVEKVKSGYLTAQTLVELVASEEIQMKLEAANIRKRSISLRTAQCWLKHFGWRYEHVRKGMYIDGHERDDVVAYRQEFLGRWKEYERRMVTYDSETGEPTFPKGFPITPGTPFRLILITQDECTFYANDQRKLVWNHLSTMPTPLPKGEGQSIMVSDFLTSDWGRLTDGDEDCRVLFRAGANRDGYFKVEDLIAQVDRGIDIFEGRVLGKAQGLWLFDNAPSHQKRAPDARSARRMPIKPCASWTPVKGGPRMRPGAMPNGDVQDFYFPDSHPTMPGWFKGMEQIIRER